MATAEELLSEMLSYRDANVQLNPIPADHAVISAYVPKVIQPKLKAMAKDKGVSVSVLVGQWIAARVS